MFIKIQIEKRVGILLSINYFLFPIVLMPDKSDAFFVCIIKLFISTY